MTGFVEKAFATPVSVDLLSDVLNALAKMPAADRQTYEGRAFRVFQLLDDRAEEGDRGAIAFAIQLRLEALARLHDDQGLRAWTLRGEQEGMDYVHADVVAAAATEPLIALNDREVGFDPESFRTRVLTNADVRGNA